MTVKLGEYWISLGLPYAVAWKLEEDGITSLDDLELRSAMELRRIKGVGAKSVNMMRAMLNVRGRHLRGDAPPRDLMPVAAAPAAGPAPARLPPQVGDVVDHNQSDGSMGAGLVVAVHRTYAIVWYVNYPGCYRALHFDDVIPWEPRRSP